MTNFGWDLPPGVSLRHIEEQMGEDEEYPTPKRAQAAGKCISPDAQIANLLDALRRTANLESYNGQLEEIRSQLEYVREQFTLLQAGELKPLPVSGDPFVEF